MHTSMDTTSRIKNFTMEKALIIWVEDQNRKPISIDKNSIQNKAAKPNAIYFCEKVDF